MICFGESLAREALSQEAGGSDGRGGLLADGLDREGLEANAQAGRWEPGLSDTMILPAIQPEPDPVEAAPPAASVWPASPPSPAPPGAGRAARRWAAAAVIGVVLVIGGLLLVLQRRGPAASGPVARVESAAGARWGGGADLAPGAVLKPGAELVLAEGCAAVRFEDGTGVVIEAPARLTIESGKSIRLASGKVAVKMPAGSSGFAVGTASGTVTDLGTEFGVAVDPSAGAGVWTEVQVFQGRVQIAPAGAATGAPCGAHRALGRRRPAWSRRGTRRGFPAAG